MAEGSCAPKSARGFFLIRLLPPRPTFLVDMNEAEQRVMGEHAGYWKKLLDEGVAFAFGPVADPKGAWGVGIIEVEGEGGGQSARKTEIPRSSPGSAFATKSCRC